MIGERVERGFRNRVHRERRGQRENDGDSRASKSVEAFNVSPDTGSGINRVEVLTGRGGAGRRPASAAGGRFLAEVGDDVGEFLAGHRMLKALGHQGNPGRDERRKI